MIFTIGIFTSFFYFILLLNKKHKSLPDNILALWMFVIGIHLTGYYVYSKGYWEIYPHLVGTTAPVPFFYGPLLYLYVVSSISGQQRLHGKDYLHFLPIVLTYLYLFEFYFFYTEEEKRLVDQGLIDDFSTFINLMVAGFIISAVMYTIYSYRLLDQHKKLLENNFSNTERINLSWLKGFIWAVGLLFITVALVLISQDVFNIRYPFTADYIFYTIIVLGILCLGYFGIRHQNVFSDNVVLRQGEPQESAYKKSSLKGELAGKKHQALTQLMVEQKPYLQPNLTLTGLANQLDISLHHLSQIINQFEGQNFNDFVNKYRVEEFIERAKKDTHYSYLALALDSGFNSKSTFNAVFRKHKGVTPSKYMTSLEEKAS